MLHVIFAGLMYVAVSLGAVDRAEARKSGIEAQNQHVSLRKQVLRPQKKGKPATQRKRDSSYGATRIKPQRAPTDNTNRNTQPRRLPNEADATPVEGQNDLIDVLQPKVRRLQKKK
jgi:hypothetical protein